MRALLDVDVRVALLDEGHLHHRASCDWLQTHRRQGWASCPSTQNGCLRVLSQPSYANSQPTAVIVRSLRAAIDRSHEFWPDSFSLLDEGRLRWDRVLTSRQITDTYLLSLAVERDARFVTFDRGISIAAVPGAAVKHLVTLGIVS